MKNKFNSVTISNDTLYDISNKIYNFLQSIYDVEIYYLQTLNIQKSSKNRINSGKENYLISNFKKGEEFIYKNIHDFDVEFMLMNDTNTPDPWCQITTSNKTILEYFTEKFNAIPLNYYLDDPISKQLNSIHFHFDDVSLKDINNLLSKNAFENFKTSKN